MPFLRCDQELADGLVSPPAFAEYSIFPAFLSVVTFSDVRGHAGEVMNYICLLKLFL